MAAGDHTIKPAGGGDYVSFAAWASARNAESGEQKATVFNGGDAGSLAVSSWTGSALIEVDPASKHSGFITNDTFGDWARIEKNGGSGQLLDWGVSNDFRIDGLSFRVYGTLSGVVLMLQADGDGISKLEINACYFYAEADGGQYCAALNLGENAGSVGYTGVRVTNNIYFMSSKADLWTGGDLMQAQGGSSATMVIDEISGNTMVAHQELANGFRLRRNGSVTRCHNNIIGSAVSISAFAGVMTFTNPRSNNATTDATASDPALRNIVLADIFGDFDNGDLRHVAGSVIADAGIDRSAEQDLDTDAIDVPRDSDPTIGALEAAFAAAGGTTPERSYPRGVARGVTRGVA